MNKILNKTFQPLESECYDSNAHTDPWEVSELFWEGKDGGGAEHERETGPVVVITAL